MSIDVRLLFKSYGRCPARLVRGNVPVVYFDVCGQLLCADCANERAYCAALTRLHHAEPLLVTTLCDTCLKELSYAGV